MAEKQKKQPYESIMKSVAKTVKKTLNEFNVFGVEVTSLQQGKMSDIDDTDLVLFFFECRSFQRININILFN